MGDVIQWPIVPRSRPRRVDRPFSRRPELTSGVMLTKNGPQVHDLTSMVRTQDDAELLGEFNKHNG